MPQKQWFNNVLHLHPVHEEGAEFRSSMNVMHLSMVSPRIGGGGEQPTGIRPREAHVGGDFDIHNGPRPGWKI